MIEIDGSEGEGGGQVLRSALALSTLTGEPFRITRIRAKRDRPGLAAQHLTAVEGVRSLSDAKVTGARIGSTELSFEPGRIVAGKRRLDVGTAGSVTLVIQACLLALAKCDEVMKVSVSGGTNVRWSPGTDFYLSVLFPLMRRLGARIEMEVLQRGFYPEGGGDVSLTVRPWERHMPFHAESRGRLMGVGGVCFSRNLPSHVCQRMSDAVRKAFFDLGPRIKSDTGHGRSTGAGIQLWAEYENTLLGADSLGERGLAAEKVGDAAASALRLEIESPATLDVHAADQLLPYLALSNASSRFYVRETSGHLTTQAKLVQGFLEAEVRMSQDAGGVLVEVTPKCT